MKKIILFLLLVLSSFFSYSQYILEGLGTDLKSMETYYVNNTISTPRISASPTGSTGFTIVDLIENKGAIMVEQRLDANVVRQKLWYLSTVTTTFYDRYTVSSPVDISNADIVTSYTTDFTGLYANLKKYTINLVTNVNTYPATNVPERDARLTVAYRERITSNNGLTWDWGAFESKSIFYVARSTDLLETLPTQFISTDADFRFTYKDWLTESRGETRSGNGLKPIYEGIFQPSQAPIGDNTITYTFAYLNGTFQTSKIVNVCNAEPAAPIVTASGGTVLCNGATVTLTATGSDILWSDGRQGNSIVVSSPNVYYAVSRNKCGTSQFSNIVEVTSQSVPSPPTLTASGSTYICNGSSVFLYATGSNITWSNGATGNSIQVFESGNYFAFDSNECGRSENSQAINVVAGVTPPTPVISANGSTELCNGATVTLTATGSNLTWSTGETGNSIVVSTAGEYYAYAGGSVCGISPISNKIVITEVNNTVAPTVTASGTTDLCNGATVTLTATGSNLIWSTGETGNSIVVSTPGTYYAYYTSSCGQSPNSNQIEVTTANLGNAPTITTNSYYICNGSSTILTATGSNIMWSNGQSGNSITVYSPGTYYAYESVACGNSPRSNEIIIQGIPPVNPAPVVTSDNGTILCNGGSIILTATGTNIQWNTGQTGNSITVTEAGFYFAISPNECGTSMPSNFMFITSGTTPPAPTVTASGTTSLCNGATVTLTASGSNLTWSTGETGNSIVVSNAGTYYAYSTNDCGQSANSNSITVTSSSTQPAPLVIASGSTDLCNGATVTLTANGSNLTWSNGATGNTLVVSTSGTYFAYSTNECGQSENSNSITVTTNNTPSAPTVTATGATSLCNGATVTLTATGSNLTWSTGETGNSIVVSNAGSYYAYTTNDCGQSPNSNSITVTTDNTPSAPTVTATGATSLCNGATVTLTATGSNLTWSTGETGNSIVVSNAGTYYAYSTNDCGQSPNSNSITVNTDNTPSAPTVTATGATSLCNGATVTLTATGSNLTWSTGETGNSIVVSNAGTYYAYSTNDCGQSPNSNSITVTTNNTPSAPTVTASGATDLCNGATVTLTATGSNLTWSTGETGNSIVVSNAGTYYAYSTNDCGQSSNSNSVIVRTGTVNTPIISSTATIIFSNESITLSSNVSGPIEWFRNNVSVSIGGNSYTTNLAGVYKAREINSIGCASDFSNEITITKYSDDDEIPVIKPPITPDVDIIDNGDGTSTMKFCIGQTHPITAPLADSYKWFRNGIQIIGQTSRILQVSQSGDYTVQITKSGNSYTTPILKVELYSVPNRPIIHY